MEPTEPITVRTPKDIVHEIDSLAAIMDRSRNYIVNQALRQYIDANGWQLARIKDGIAATHEGRVQPADDVFTAIARKHGWSK
jgi:predicted transcriptional regulator